ncbi:uncharacterized protein LOC114533462 isoform X1 [Dendronephthya gigantea]|uniref:uncharacterized protein LOC114533462 isoform X1 n=1 Tax=Dendronephthya gigantea TaxID=151771 RepID=UPI00106CD09C|nr:uncharacterized protein LOC114533462 isoform X1 [Dendronephthya gigantea]
MSIGLWTFLGSVLCVLKINGLLMNVTRGYRDSIYTNIQQIPTTARIGLICDDGARFCRCKKNTNYVRGKCVKDHEIVEDRSSCYRFADGKFIKLINTTRCAAHHDRCNLEIKIQAPINAEHTKCRLVWETSAVSISGFEWRSFHGEVVPGIQLNTTVYPPTLQIINVRDFLSKWKGHLIRFDIECRNDNGSSEHNCTLFKVEGTATEEIPDQTANTPSTISTLSMMSSSPSSFHSEKLTTPSQKLSSTEISPSERDSQDENDDDESSPILIPIIISASILFCLLLAATVIIIVCKRQQKKFEGENQNEEHIYEEAHPVDKGPVSPIYMDIDNLTRSKSKKRNSSRKANGSQTYDEPKNPFYHTLERTTTDRTNDNNGIYEEIDDILKSPSPKSKPKQFEEEMDV